VFTNLEIIENVEMISQRCFNYVLVAINPRSYEKPLFDHETDILVSQLSLMAEVYEDEFWDTLGFVFLSASNQGTSYIITVEYKNIIR